MDLFEPDARRVALGVGRYKQTARKSSYTLAVRCGGPSIRLFILDAGILPLRVLVDPGHVPDVRLWIPAIVVYIAGRGGRWSVRYRGGSVRRNFYTYQRLTAYYTQTGQRKVLDVITNDQHVAVYLYYIDASTNQNKQY